MRNILFKLFLLLATFFPVKADVSDFVPLTFAVICLAQACHEVALEQRVKNRIKEQEHKKITAQATGRIQDILEICSKRPELTTQCNNIFQNIIATYKRVSEANEFSEEDLAILRKLKDNKYRDVMPIKYKVLRETSVPTETLYHLNGKQKKSLTIKK